MEPWLLGAHQDIRPVLSDALAPIREIRPTAQLSPSTMISSTKAAA
jgi:hypothetical protein